MFEVRPVADQDEYGRAIGAIGQYFNPPPGEEMLARFVRTLPHERMHAAFEDGQIVGGAGAFPFELSVPGGSLPCAGVTAVGVHPTHRRRGVRRRLKLRSKLRRECCACRSLLAPFRTPGPRPSKTQGVPPCKAC